MDGLEFVGAGEEGGSGSGAIVEVVEAIGGEEIDGGFGGREGRGGDANVAVVAPRGKGGVRDSLGTFEPGDEPGVEGGGGGVCGGSGRGGLDGDVGGHGWRRWWEDCKGR